MFFSSPSSNITPVMASVAMSRSDSRDSTSSSTNYYTSHAPTSAYSALVSASPTSAWPSSEPLARTDSSTSTTTSQAQSVPMRRDSSNSSWMPSPYRSCMSSFGAEPSSYLSDDDLLCSAEDLNLPIETIPALVPKKELTTEEQIALLRELQEKEAASAQYQAATHSDAKRRVVRFANQDASCSSKPRRPSTNKRRQTTVRRCMSSLNGPQ
ncbi:hypothetical protein G647_07285 [Cladophialophora carrionii CBS 160.54]|uniref:Uncharacterized protein n=1 Tax=Cladophialophora carrionii CBS 160.54 TaxID=1279043 RepID=V9D4N2_9EURO|nr:uncharacterized protein G647_07285 [Cladophialophora carrionii CBS 160.54]ETI20942.1 hypothetical protein G647_07285 [Cladophialophora carrionii CBS 160.54]